MPLIYKIDKEHRPVVSTASGTLTLDDFLSHQSRLLEDPDFDTSYSQLADFTQVTQLVPAQGGVEKVAQKDVFSPISRRAIAVKNDLQYGFARMSQSTEISPVSAGPSVPGRRGSPGLDFLQDRHER